MVYFIQNSITGDIKIGSSSNIARRRDELQVGNSSVLRILYVIEIPEDESLAFERHVQGVSSMYALEGEWFKEKVIEHLLNHPWYRENMRPVEARSQPLAHQELLTARLDLDQ